jgi:uncharacterized integral membrane protein
MARLWLKIKFWSKTVLISAAVIYVLLFTGFNSRESVNFWYWFGHAPTEPLLLLVVYAFFAGAITTVLVWTSLHTAWQKQREQGAKPGHTNGRVPGDTNRIPHPTIPENGAVPVARPMNQPEVKR